jgi:D-alanine--poly(phosphoribitol) ligase subunit 2
VTERSLAGGRQLGGAPQLDADEFDILVRRVQQLLIEKLYIDSPTPDTDLIDNGALDSFALVELLVNIEELFGVEVPVEDLEVDDFRSASRIARLIAFRGRPDAR